MLSIFKRSRLQYGREYSIPLFVGAYNFYVNLSNFTV